MNLSDKQRKEFESLAKEMMAFLIKNCHPHISVSIDSTKAELKEGIVATVNDGFDSSKNAPEFSSNNEVVLPAGMVVKYQDIPCRLTHDTKVHGEYDPS